VVCANGSGGAVLGDITLEQMLANGASSVVGTATDPGPHAVGTCHTLTLSSPVATGHTTLLVSITASYPGGTVSIGDVTFHWVPVAKA
jgi:hypothetical protein